MSVEVYIAFPFYIYEKNATIVTITNKQFNCKLQLYWI